MKKWHYLNKSFQEKGKISGTLQKHYLDSLELHEKSFKQVLNNFPFLVL